MIFDVTTLAYLSSLIPLLSSDYYAPMSLGNQICWERGESYGEG